MAVHTGSSASIHCLFANTAVRSFADRRELLFAVKTFTTGDLEGCYDTFTDFAILDLRADLLNNPTKLMAENVAFLKLGNGTCGTVVSKGRSRYGRSH